MREKIQNHIHDLIQNMNKSERRYFKIYASKHVIGEENNYEALFDFLCSQAYYDENELKKRFAGQLMLNNLTITMHRLYDHLLKALESYHSSTSIDLELRHLLNYAEILFNKSLYIACFKMCRKIKKLAEENDRHVAILEHNILVKKLFEVENYEKTDGNELENILSSDNNALQDLLRISELWFIKSKLLNKLNTMGPAKNEIDQNFYLNLTKDIQRPQSALFEENYLYYHSKAACAFGLGKNAECIEYVQYNLELFEDHPEKKETQLNRYISLLSNAIYLNHILLNFDQARHYLQRLKILNASFEKKLTDDLALKLFNSTYSTELMINIHTGNFDANIELIPKIESLLKHFSGKISIVRKTYYYYCFAISHLALDQPKASLKYINSVLHAEKTQHVQDMLDATRVLHLLALTELKEKQLVTHLLKSVKRHLVQQQKWRDFEKLLFKYMEKWVKLDKIWEEEEEFSDFVDLIEKNIKIYVSSPIYHIFPFKCWAESKFKNKSVALCIKNQLAVLSK